MGHFLCYYADFAKSPLYHEEERERRIIDLCKVTFVRPVSNHDDVPPNSFDICTIEREWTLSAESKASMQRWLQNRDAGHRRGYGDRTGRVGLHGEAARRPFAAVGEERVLHRSESISEWRQCVRRDGRRRARRAVLLVLHGLF